MDDNVSKKIKCVAKIITPLGTLLSFILSILVSYWTDIKLYLIIISLGGSLLSWFISLCLHGFGQLVENSHRTVELLEKLNRCAKKNANQQENNTPKPL